VRKFGSLTSVNPIDSVKRIMARIMTEELMRTYTWSGTAVKKSFENKGMIIEFLHECCSRTAEVNHDLVKRAVQAALKNADQNVARRATKTPNLFEYA
jgi:hypothetical protein